MIRKAMVFSTAILVAALSSPVHASEQLTTYVADLTGYIDISPDGSVLNYSLEPLLNASDRALIHAIDRRIRSWRFEPVTKLGQPVVAHVLVEIKLRAETKPDSHDMVLSLDDVQFNDPPLLDWSGKPLASFKTPLYPEHPLQAEAGARVMVTFLLDDDGKVLNKEVSTIDLLLLRPVSPREQDRYVQDFRKATLDAAEDWKFPDAYRHTCGKPCLVNVPVYYAVSGVFWSGLKPVPMAPLPWAAADQPVVRIDTSGAQQSSRKLVDPAQAVGQL